MKKKYDLIAAAEIAIMDSYEKGVILIFKVGEKGFVATCVVGRTCSPLFKGVSEREPYGSCREWFSEMYDGFLQVDTLKLDDERIVRALERSQDRLAEA